MLLSFTVENFRSFDGCQELSLVANTRQTTLAEHLVAVPSAEEKVLPVAAVFGANGAGKSNLTRALAWFRATVLGSRPALDPFLFSPPERPTRMEARFLVGERVLQYGFEVGALGLSAEWLSEVRSTGREQVVFERKTDPAGTTIEFGSDVKATKRLEALKVFGVPAEEVLLRRMVMEVSAAERPPQAGDAWEWFSRLIIIGPEARPTGLSEQLKADAPVRAYLRDTLRHVGSGVEEFSLNTETISREHLPALLHSSFDQAKPKDVLQFNDGSMSTEYTKLDAHHAERFTLRSVHRGPGGVQKELDFAEESDGTRRLLELAPAAYVAGITPRVFVVDELDRSLHPHLVRAFVQGFLKRAHGQRSQLIFTAHETHVLDQELLRRDEVWFVEKDAAGATELYSLDDYPVRNDLRLDRGYLQGRFGAVPPPGDLP